MSRNITCLEAEEHLLEALDDRLPDDLERAVDGHLATCVRCTGFAASLRVIDTQLTAALVPTPPPASIAINVRARVRRERRAAISESLPDLIHLAGCGAATVLSAALLPIEAPVTIVAGIALTAATYVVMALVRWSLEAVDQPDW